MAGKSGWKQRDNSSLTPPPALFILRPPSLLPAGAAINTFAFLASCARLDADESFYHDLARRAGEFTGWEQLAIQAEAHGLGPLAYTHLKAAAAPMPRATKQALQGLYLRHRHANQVRAQVLAEVLAACRQANIDVLLLKGVALAHLVYPQPELRPMRDMDLLVSQAQARPAQALLAQLGFDAPPPGDNLPAKHLVVAQRQTEGLTVSIEIHHNLYSDGHPATELAALRPAAVPLAIEGETTYTLGVEALLNHVYQHLRVNLLRDSLRLIWIADMAGLAERFAATIDWAQVEPAARRALAVCHWLTPLSPTLRTAAALEIGRSPRDFGVEFAGWPRFSLAAQRHKSYAAILRDSFIAPEWWLRLYYGAGSGRSLAWQRWVIHPATIAKMALQTILSQPR